MLLIITGTVILNVGYAQEHREEPAAGARAVAIKTNLLHDAAATLSIGAEFRLTDKLSLDVPLAWNPFQFSDNRKWKHFLVQPELRLWMKEPFTGHFFGFHAHYAYYNVGNLPKPFSSYMREHRFQGWLLGVGASYGYRWNFSRHWGLEATIGIGYAYMDYDNYSCSKCAEKIASQSRHYFGLTKTGISLIYTFGGHKKNTSQPVPVNVTPAVIEIPVAEPAAIPEAAVQTIFMEEKISTGDKLAQSYPFMAPYEEYKEFDQQEFVFSPQERDEAITVHFRQGSFLVSEDYGDNRQALTDIMSTIRVLENSTDSEVAAVTIAGFSSPEGSAQVNERLAMRRAEALKTYILGRCGVRSGRIRTYNGEIDWDGLRRLVEASDMSMRGAVLDIIDNIPVWDAQRRRGRLGELMRLDGGDPYRYILREFFPKLRNAAYIKIYYRNK